METVWGHDIPCARDLPAGLTLLRGDITLQLEMDKIRADKQRRRNHSVVSEGVEEGGQKMRNNEPGEYKTV